MGYLTLSFAFLLALTPFSLFSNPSGEHVISGSATFTREGSTHLLVETSERAIIQWDKFSIEQGDLTRFIQPSKDAAVLNRVSGAEMSRLMGLLEANGKVYLINPQGVIIGKDARIDTAAFLASTQDVLDASFLANLDLLFQGNSSASIVNHGVIRAWDGDVVLLAQKIENHGEIQAPNGSVAIGAGYEILLQPRETRLLRIAPNSSQETGVENSGQIAALRAEIQTDGHVYGLGINHSGRIDASTLTAEGGKVYLRAPNMEISGNVSAQEIATDGSRCTITETGSLVAPEGSIAMHSAEYPIYQLGLVDVSGEKGGTIEITAAKLYQAGKLLAQGTEGGSIHITLEGAYIEPISGHIAGGNISLAASMLFSSGHHVATGDHGGHIAYAAEHINLVTTEIDASGLSQGGSIDIGLPSGSATKTIFIGHSTKVLAHAQEMGNGGEVLVDSLEKTECYGTINASGGILGGNGGFIELSSKGDLFYNGTVSARAPLGEAGQILFDPKNLTIDSVSGVYPQYQFIDPNQGGGTLFGRFVQPSSGSNSVLITKPNDNFAATNAGAVYLYDGLTAALISAVTGSASGDLVGNGQPALLANGNFVAMSFNWNGGRGAATWINQTTGLSGTISSSNSLTGSTNLDFSTATAIALTNGNYVVRTPQWTNGGSAAAGAATWGNGTSGVSGVISSTISLVGGRASDQVSSVVIALTNGNYVVTAPNWDNPTGPVTDVGAATWCNGSTGRVGLVSTTNSLVGSTASDLVGFGGVTALSNGNYVVASPNWANGLANAAGAATWGNGTTGTVGTVSTANSFVGSTALDDVGQSITALTNGNYVVRSSTWDNPVGPVVNVGAATWGNGTNGQFFGGGFGALSATNSLIGGTAADTIGTSGIVALTNGNYVVCTQTWDNPVGPVLNVGAATWGNGNGGTVGLVSSSNSFIGSTSADAVGNLSAVALINGNYVVRSSTWDNPVGPVANVGAATWGNGTNGQLFGGGFGIVSSTNSLMGSTNGDGISNGGVLALTNGNYVVCSSNWDNPVGPVGNVGAATWCRNDGSTVGPISSANSLVGSTTNDNVGISPGGIALSNGNYVVRSPNWDNPIGPVANVGAFTWGNGTGGTVGAVSVTNSLVGSIANDGLSANLVALSNSDYVVETPGWNNGSTLDAGAVTYGNGTGGTVGAITAQNSIVGSTASSDLQPPMENLMNDTFIAAFNAEGTSGRVRVGLFNVNAITFARAQAQDMAITPASITSLLEAGTPVSLQANNDITISSAITTAAGLGADLSLTAGRSILVNADIRLEVGDLTLVANEPLSGGVVDAQRAAGSAVITLASGTDITAVSGSVTIELSNGAGKTNATSGDITLGTSATITALGPLSIFAEDNNIVLGDASLIRSTGNNVLMQAGKDISSTGSPTISSAGDLILVVDNLFPAAPFFGTGKFTFSSGTTLTAGNVLRLFSSQRSLNTLPTTINGSVYTPTVEGINNNTERWGVYYPNGDGGIPFRIFYKNPDATLPRSLTALERLYNNQVLIEPFLVWNAHFYGELLSDDRFPPLLTFKSLLLYPNSLVNINNKPLLPW